MKASRTVQKILSYYESDNPGVKGNLCRMLMQGRLGGTGKMIILPVDQGFEHGPGRPTTRTITSSSRSMPGSTPMPRRSG
jgi:hypothetical protein